MNKLALSIIFLCTSPLYGMKRSADEHYIEPDTGSELKPEMWGQEQLPEEVKALIMVALAQSGNNLDEVINNIKKVSLINKTFNQMINDLQRFTQVVHMIADKFNVATETVAEEFTLVIADWKKLGVANKYIELGRNLLKAVWHKWPLDKLEELIKNGADINYSRPCRLFKNCDQETPMVYAMKGKNLEAITLLLKSGVKLESDEYYDKHEYWWPHTKQAIKQLIDEERAKRSIKESL
jgi:hypothetical protein